MNLHRTFALDTAIACFVLILVSPFVLPLHASANVVGIGAQNFNPTPDGLDFVTVQSSKTLEPGIFNFGVFLNNAWNTLPFIDSANQTRIKLNDSLLGVDLNLGVGLLRNWEVGVSFPAVLQQTIEDQQSIHGQFTRAGNTEIRVNSKYRLLVGETWGIAVIGTVNFDRVADDPYSGTGARPVLNIEFAGEETLGRYVIGLNVGRRFRHSGTPIVGSPIDPMRDQWIASIAMSRLITQVSTKIIAEIFAALPAEQVAANAARNQSSAELLIGAKHDWSTQLALHAGLGTSLVRGISSPDWRVYAGLNYAFGPLWGAEQQVTRVSTSSTRSYMAPSSEDEEPLSVDQTTVKSRDESASTPIDPMAPENFRVGNILFEFNSANLVAGHEGMLAPLVAHLKEKPFRHLTIEGHTDSVGRSAYNLDLSRRRAESVRLHLTKTAGIPSAKVEAVGYGAARPIQSNSNYQGRQANRRVEFKIEH